MKTNKKIFGFLIKGKYFTNPFLIGLLCLATFAGNSGKAQAFYNTYTVPLTPIHYSADPNHPETDDDAIGIANVLLVGEPDPQGQDEIISNPSGVPPLGGQYPSYTDYTTAQTTSAPGSSTMGIPNLMVNKQYSISLTTGWWNPQDFGVWIDYNDDGVFEDSEHIVDAYGNTNYNHVATATTSFSIPGTASAGQHRMRISTESTTGCGSLEGCYASPGNSGDQQTYGEFEDYEVNLIPGPPGSGIISTARANSNGEVALSWTAPDAGQDPTGIDDYIIYYGDPHTCQYPYVGTSCDTDDTQSASTSATISHLSSGKTYTFALMAHNSIGNGAPSQWDITPPEPCSASPDCIIPNNGDIAGGTSVIISGEHFVTYEEEGSHSTVKFGSADATAYGSITSTSITATTPPGAKGPVDVTVTNPNGTSVIFYNAFTYTDIGHSTMSANPSSILNDNTTTSLITVTLKDSSNALKIGKTVQVAKIAGTGNPTITAVVCASGGSAGVTNSVGKACFRVKSADVATDTFQATDITDNAIVAQTADVIFAPFADANNSTLSQVDPKSVPADGTTPSGVLTVTLLDGSSVAVPGKTVTLTPVRTSSGSPVTTITQVDCSSPSTPAPSAVTDSNGKACFTAASSDGDTNGGVETFVAEDTTDSVTVDQPTPRTVKVTFTPIADAGNSTIGADPTSVPADGTDYSTITVTLLDGASTSVPGKNVTLNCSRSGGCSPTTTVTPTNCASSVSPFPTPGTTNTDGQACFTATSMDSTTNGGVETFTAKDTDDSVTLAASADVTFTPAALSPPTLTNVWSKSPDMFLQWTPVDGATSYKVFYGPSSGFPAHKTEIDTVDASDTSYIISVLTPGTPYSFYVKTVNAGGDSFPSNTITKTIFTPPTFIYNIPTQQPLNFSRAGGLAINQNTGYLWMTDSKASQLINFDPNSQSNQNRIGTYGDGNNGGQFENPAGVATDASGYVYVVDSNNNRIQKFDSDGNFVTEWGSQGSGDSQFSSPTGIAVDGSDNVYVVDSGNNRIEEFDPNNSFVTQWNGSDTGTQFNNPQGIAVDGSGNVYVADSGNNRIVECTSAGDCSRTPTFDPGSPAFNNPQGIAVDGSSNVYVTDSNYRVVKFDSSGTLITQFGSQGGGDGQFISGASAITIDTSGNIFVGEAALNRIQEFTSNDGITYNHLATWGDGGAHENQFNIPAGAAVDPYGNDVFVVDSNNNRIEKFDNYGNFQFTFGFGVQDGGNSFETCSSGCQAGLSGAGDGQFASPTGIAADNTGGDIYVVDAGNNRIEKFDNNGNYVTQWNGLDTGTAFNNPQGIAASTSNGLVYIADSGNNRIVQCVDYNGECLTNSLLDGSNITSGPASFNHPRGVAVDSSNNVYVADSNNNRIVKFDSSGNYLTQWGTVGSGDGQFSAPGLIGADSSGNVYVPDQSNHRVEEFDGTGTLIKDWGFVGGDNGNFQNPAAVAVSSSTGKIYVTDLSLNNVEAFGTGSDMSIWSVSSSALASATSLGATVANNGLDVSGNYAYLTETAANSLLTYDNSDPTLPVLESTTDTTTPFSYAPGAIKISGNYAYVAGTVGSDDQLVIYDINTTPGTPIYKGHVSIGTNSGPSAIGVLNSGPNTYAYIANKTSGDVTIVNVTDPALPTFASTYTPNPEAPAARGSNPTVGGIAVGTNNGTNYAYFSYSSTSPADSYLYILDLTTPTAPALVTNFALPWLSNPFDVELTSDANHVYIQNSSITAVGNNFIELDVSSPASPGFAESSGSLSPGGSENEVRLALSSDGNPFFGYNPGTTPTIEANLVPTTYNSGSTADPSGAIKVLGQNLVFSGGPLHSFEVLNSSFLGSGGTSGLAYQGHDIVYNMNVSNNGPLDADHATLTGSSLPGHTTASVLIGGSPTSCTNLPCDMGTFPSGTWYPITVIIHVSPAATTGSITPTFTVSSASADPNSGNNSINNLTTVVTASNDTIPNAPINLTATAGNGQVSLQWSAPAGGSAPSGYVIAFGKSSGPTCTPLNPAVLNNPATYNCTLQDNNSSTSATVGSLTNGDEYVFAVYAENSVGPNTTPTNDATATPTGGSSPTAPSAITNLAANPGDAQVTLTWSAPNNNGASLDKYLVAYGDSTDTSCNTDLTSGTVITSPAYSGTCTVAVLTGTPPTTGDIITPLTNGTNYNFVVYSHNSVDWSAVSNEPNATPAAGSSPTAPSAISNLAANPGDSQVSLTWSAPNDNGASIDNYLIAYGDSTDTACNTDLSNGAVTSPTYTGHCTVDNTHLATAGATITSLTNGTNYNFVVYSHNSVDWSAASNEPNATPAAGSTGGGTGTSTGTVTITCPLLLPPASLVAVPQPIVFNPVNSPTGATSVSTVDALAGSGNFPGGNKVTGGVLGTPVTDDHLLRVQDQTSQGVPGCGGNDDWAVSAHISTFHTDPQTHVQTPALTNADDTDYIPASSMKIVTTTQVDKARIDNGGTMSAATNGVYYDDYTASGWRHSVDAPVNANGTGTLDFTATGTNSPYDVSSNTLENSVPLLKHCEDTPPGTGENSDIYTGVAVAIDQGIHPRQAEGTYTGTIEYDWTLGGVTGC